VALTEGRDPQVHPQETVDRLEADALATGEPRAENDSGDGPDVQQDPVYDQDKDVEDLPGGAGERGGSTSEPSG
jgi:hypothetical protein